MTILGQRIRHYRARAGLRQVDVAERAGIYPKHYAEIERGHHRPTARTYQRIATVLNIPDLLPEEQRMLERARAVIDAKQRLDRGYNQAARRELTLALERLCETVDDA